MTIGDFIADVRAILRDTGTNPHYSDLVIMNGVVDAFRRLRSIRPESRYVNGVLTGDIAFPSTETELRAFTVDFDIRWRLGIVYFSASRCYETDITDTVNMQLAQTLRQKADAEFAI